MSVVLARRAVRQPQPAISPGGDCGACVLGGLLGVDPATAYDKYHRRGRTPFTRGDMRDGLWDASAHGLVDRIVEDAPMWHPHRGTAFGFLGYMMSYEWYRYVRMAFEAGYYGLAQVSHEREGAAKGETNHWVMLCGYRERREPHPTVAGAGSIFEEVLVSNSNRNRPDEEWVERETFVRDWGGFDLLLARPT